ncbi:MAG: hypothetical protein HYY44_00270 [Deltaproteobacteria bacterium]|nr:hypothetical protein [Deltaproteobacteria bacterium]
MYPAQVITVRQRIVFLAEQPARLIRRPSWGGIFLAPGPAEVPCWIHQAESLTVTRLLAPADPGATPVVAPRFVAIGTATVTAKVGVGIVETDIIAIAPVHIFVAQRAAVTGLLRPAASRRASCLTPRLTRIIPAKITAEGRIGIPRADVVTAGVISVFAAPLPAPPLIQFTQLAAVVEPARVTGAPVVAVLRGVRGAAGVVGHLFADAVVQTRTAPVDMRQTPVDDTRPPRLPDTVGTQGLPTLLTRVTDIGGWCECEIGGGRLPHRPAAGAGEGVGTAYGILMESDMRQPAKFTVSGIRLALKLRSRKGPKAKDPSGILKLIFKLTQYPPMRNVKEIAPNCVVINQT